MIEERVDILMATYNGEKYIREQLDSIINQTYKNWKLYIRDDGSRDKTLEYIYTYSKKERRISILNDKLKNLGVAKNFEELLKKSKSSLVMFSDQDDVWKKNKIKKLVDYSSKLNQNEAFMVCSLVDVVNEKLEFLYKSKYSIKSSNIKDYLFQNGGQQGSSFLINRKLINASIPFPSTTWMHDQLLTLNTSLFGEIFFIDESLMYYRQHSNNVLGSQEGWISKIKRFKFLFISIMDRKKILFYNEYYQKIENQISEKNKRMFKDFFEINTNINLFKKIYLIIKNKFTLRNSIIYLLLRCLTLRGKK